MESPSTCLSGAGPHVSGWAPDTRVSVSRSGLLPTAVSSTVPLRPSEAPLTFKPGDKVVYPHHGAAIVEKKEKRKAFGENTEYLVLRMTDGDMTLSVPVDKVEEVGMRWPISKEDVEDLFEVLQKRDIRTRQLVAPLQEPSGEAEERRCVPGGRGRPEPGAA